MKRSRSLKAIVLTAAVLTATIGLTASISSAGPLIPSAIAGWPRQLGTNLSDSATGVGVSAAGDVYVTGFTAGKLDPSTPDGNGWDAFVTKYDKYGIVKWTRQVGTSLTDGANGIAVSPAGDVFLVGNTDGKLDPTTPDGNGRDAFVVKFDKNGNRKWLRQFGTNLQDAAYGVAVSAGGDVYVTGLTTGKLDPATPDGTNQDAFIVKYNRYGTRKWLRQFGSSGKESAAKVAVSGGGIYVTGSTNGALVPGAVPDVSGDAYLARYDGNGTQKWMRQIASTVLGPGHYDEGWGVAASGSDVYVSGWTNGNLGPTSVFGHGYDEFVARFTNTGTPLQIGQVGTVGNEAIASPALGVSGTGVFLASSTDGAFSGFTNQGGDDGFISRSTRDLTPVWTRQFGTNNDDNVAGLAIRGTNGNGGALVVAGTTNGTLWGQINYGSDDALIATFLR